MKEKRLTNTDRTIQMIPVRKQTELEQVEHGMSDRVVCALHSEWFDPETGIPYYLTFS